MKTTKLFLILLIACIGGITVQAQTATPAPASEIVVSETSVGPITKTSPFNQRQLQALLPVLTVKRATGMSESQEFPVIHILDKKQLLMIVYQGENPKKIGSVEIISTRIKLASGVKRGAAFAQIYPSLKTLEAAGCEAGLEEQSDQIFCSAPGSKHVTYGFAGPGEMFTEAGMRPVKFFRNWKVKTIFWRP